MDERAQPAATAVATIADPIVRAHARQILDAMGRSPRPPEAFLVERVIDPSCRRVGCGMAVDESVRHAGNGVVIGANPAGFALRAVAELRPGQIDECAACLLQALEPGGTLGSAYHLSRVARVSTVAAAARGNVADAIAVVKAVLAPAAPSSAAI